MGRAVGIADRLSEELVFRKIQYDLFTVQWPSDFEKYSEIWIVGGDGTLNYFVNQYPSIQLPLVIFKGGTGNDFHWLLYGKIGLMEQIELVLSTAARPIDLGQCNEYYFLNGLGVGFEGAVASSLKGKKKLPGKTSFFLMILKKIFSYRSRWYEISSNGLTISGKQLMISLTNGRRAGGGFHIAPEAVPDDGLLDAIIVKDLSPLRRLFYLPVIEKGRHLHLPIINWFRTTRVSIVSKQDIQFHLDGEYHIAGKLEISVIRAKLLFRY